MVNAPEPASPSAAEKPSRKRPRRRRWRILLRIAVFGPLALLLVALGLMRSPLVRSKVEQTVVALSGCRFEASSVVVGLDGRLRADDIRLTAPGVDGPAGELLTAKRAELDLDWSGLLRGNVVATALRLHEPLIRIAQSSDDNSMNLAGLQAAQATGGAGGGGRMGTPPMVSIINGRIEFAEYSKKAQTYSTLNTLQVAGSFFPLDSSGKAYGLRLAEIGRAEPVPSGSGVGRAGRGMILDGTLDLSTLDATLKLLNLGLESWPPEAVPSAYRAIWRRLNIQGQVSQTEFKYTPADGVRVQVTLSNVAMDALVPREDEAGGPGEHGADLKLREVNGTISLAPDGLKADLTGKVENQTTPSHVLLTTQGLDLNAALECRIIGHGLNVNKDPEFLSYVPETVREYFQHFSGPTADVDADVVIRRGPPVDGVPADLEVPEGKLSFRNGSAAFFRFPYPFHDLEGMVNFDDKHIEILNIRGWGPTGAELTAQAWISPLTDDALVDVAVQVRRTPVDEHLLGAMPRQKKRLLEALFDREAYEKLLRDGLVRKSPAPSGALVNPAPTVPAEGPPTAPIFDLGGLANIDVKVHRPAGANVIWTTDIGVRFDRAGLLPEPFPFPVVATDVYLKIDDDDAKVVSGTYEGLRGGHADLSASVVLEENGVPVVRPDVRIEAMDVPVDDLLIHALPDDRALGADAAPAPASNTGADRLSAKAILSRLKIEGRVDCTAEIRGIEPAAGAPPGQARVVMPEAARGGGAEPSDWDEIAFDITVNLRGLSAAPPGGSAASERIARVVDLSGAVNITQERLRIGGLTGTLITEPVGLEAQDQVEEAAVVQGSPLTIYATAPLGAERRSVAPEHRLDLSVTIKSLDLATPVEPIIGVFSEKARTLVEELRTVRTPAGMLDATVRAQGDQVHPDLPAQASVRVENVRSLDLGALGGRLALGPMEGAATLFTPISDAAARGRVVFDGASSTLMFDGARVADLKLNGAMSLQAESSRPAPPTELEVVLTDADASSPLFARALSRWADEATAQHVRDFDPAGRFDATVTISTLNDPAPGDRLVASGSVLPRSLSLTRRAADGASPTRIDFSTMTGSLTFDVGKDASAGAPVATGRFNALRAETGAWWVQLDGGWSASAAGGFAVDTGIEMGIARVDDQLRSFLPDAAPEAIEAISLVLPDGCRVGPAHLKAEFGAAGLGNAAESDLIRAAEFKGDIAFSHASADIGLTLKECDGRVSIDARTLPRAGLAQSEASRAALEVEFTADRMLAAGVRLRDARVLILSGSKPGVILIPHIEADCHTGRVFGTATVRRGNSEDAARAPQAPEFRADISLAGVPLAALLDDFEAAKGDTTADAATTLEPAAAEPDSIPPDESRGRVDAWCSIAGRAGVPESRYGRGSVRIAGGDVVRLPLILPLMQVSNLVLPLDDRLDYMQSDFFLRGETVRFGEIAVLSRSISILGDGTLTWPEKKLDMTFNSKSLSRVPLLSDLLEAVRNELITTTVKGTLDKPEINSEPLMGTRRLFGSMLDPHAGGRSFDAAAAEAAARRERSRLSGADKRAEPAIQPRAAVKSASAER